MSYIKIIELPTSNSVASTDYLPIATNDFVGTTKKVTADGLSTLALSKITWLTSTGQTSAAQASFDLGNTVGGTFPITTTAGSIRALREPSNSVTGNVRGAGAVDFQQKRFQSTQVASGLHSTIIGGLGNAASGNYSVVGGLTNKVLGGNSSIIGGLSGIVSGNNSFIGSGENNSITGSYSIVGSGAGNSVIGSYSVVVGGLNNNASSVYSVVGGGSSNTASGYMSVVVGGNTNTSSGEYSITGGFNSTASSRYAISLGGYNNATGNSSVAIGGFFNISSGDKSSITGGDSNTASDYYCAVVNGSQNISSGRFSTIINGQMVRADRIGHEAANSGVFNSIGDAQRGNLTLRNTTTTSTQTELFTDGSTSRFFLRDNQTIGFEAQIIGRRTGTALEDAFYIAKGLIKRGTGAASTIIVGSVLIDIVTRPNTNWSADVDADTTNGGLRFRVTGETSKTIRWLANVRFTEVGGA